MGVRNRGVTRAGTEPRRETHRAASMAVHRVAPDVLQQSVDDLAALALCPSTNDSAVPPHGRAGVARPVEEQRCVRSEEPVPTGPTHHSGVEAGKERGERSRSADRSDVVREDDASATDELDLLDRQHPTARGGPRRPSNRSTT